METRFEMRVSEELLAAIDERRGRLPRATWVREVLEAALGAPVAESAPAESRERVADVAPSTSRSRPGPAKPAGSVRSSGKHVDPAAARRQAELNKGKGRG